MSDDSALSHNPAVSPHRFALIRHSLSMRRPLALLGAGLALVGLIVNLTGTALDGTAFAIGSAATHPVTAALCVMLGLAVASFRYHRPTPAFRYVLGLIGAVTSAERIPSGLGWDVPVLTPMLDAWVYAPLATVASGRVGVDTAILLFFLFCSVLARRHFGRIGLAFALAALAVIINDFVALSYGTGLFGGHMAVGTLAALVPIVASVLLLFAHRPFFRTVLLSGDVGRRTRMTAVGAFLIPWGSGLLAHYLYRLPEELGSKESVTISVIIWALLLTAQFTGMVQHRADQRRRRAERQMAYLASYDPLTDVLNRRGIATALNRAWERFRDGGGAAGLILLDLDHFKSINDRCGHGAGDWVLARVGGVLTPNLRRSDAIGRWGGEEFLIVIDGATETGTLEPLCERLRRAVETIGPVACPDGTQDGVSVSASFGLSWFTTRDSSPEEALKRADDALYAAKAAGRNRTVVFDGLRRAG